MASGLVRRFAKRPLKDWPTHDHDCKAEEQGVLALSSNYALYADLSNRVMSVLSVYSPCTEVYSIDECFVDLTGTPKLRDVSYAMREQVMQCTGINLAANPLALEQLEEAFGNCVVMAVAASAHAADQVVFS